MSSTRGEERNRAATSNKLERYLARKKELKSRPKTKLDERHVTQYEKDPRVVCPGAIWEHAALLALHLDDGSLLMQCVGQCPVVLTDRVIARQGTRKAVVHAWGTLSFVGAVTWKEGRESPIGAFFTHALEGDTIRDVAVRLQCEACLAALDAPAGAGAGAGEGAPIPTAANAARLAGGTKGKGAAQQGVVAQCTPRSDDAMLHRRWFHDATGCTFEFDVQSVVRRKKLRRPFPLSHRYHYNSTSKSVHNMPSENPRKRKQRAGADAGAAAAAPAAGSGHCAPCWSTPPEAWVAIAIAVLLAAWLRAGLDSGEL